MSTKTCIHCNRPKGLEQFAACHNGIHGVCRECVSAELRERHARDRLERRRLLAERGIKRCSSCTQDRPLADFAPRPASQDGFCGYCRNCATKRSNANRKKRAEVDPGASVRKSRSYYERNAERQREKARRWRELNPAKAREIGTKSLLARRASRWQEILVASARATIKTDKYGPSDLDVVYINELYEKQGGRCYWLGLPLVASTMKRDPRRPSLDRLDSSKGYVRGNVVLACQFANMGRSTLAASDFSAFVDEMKAHMRAA